MRSSVSGKCSGVVQWIVSTCADDNVWVMVLAWSRKPWFSAQPIAVSSTVFARGTRNAGLAMVASRILKCVFSVIDATPANGRRSYKPLMQIAPRTPRSGARRSEEHTSELQSLMRISYAVFCLKKKKKHIKEQTY